MWVEFSPRTTSCSCKILLQLLLYDFQELTKMSGECPVIPTE